MLPTFLSVSPGPTPKPERPDDVGVLATKQQRYVLGDSSSGARDLTLAH